MLGNRSPFGFEVMCWEERVRQGEQRIEQLREQAWVDGA